MMDETFKSGTCHIGGVWQAGDGAEFSSYDPSDQAQIWQGHAASNADVDVAFKAARAAFITWSQTSVEARKEIVLRFQELAKAKKNEIAALISRETGKLLWDTKGEAGALSGKVDTSLKSYDERTGTSLTPTAFGSAALQHRPHGVMAVLGPYNFPAHLPNGQILPAIIAGNTVVFKPSEHTPAVGEALVALYHAAGFPPGVINLVQGTRSTGAAMLSHPDVDGVLFTGSASGGAAIHKMFGGRPEIVLALEMGGNNPLIVWDVKDAEAAALIAAQSAFMTSGQRCTCTRRLILPDNASGQAVIERLKAVTERLVLGAWDSSGEVNIGPLVSADVADQVVKAAVGLKTRGAKVLREAKIAPNGPAFVMPGLYDVSGCHMEDAEIFGPVLQIISVPDWDAAIETANATRFGLAAGLVSDDAALWDDFRARIRAGVVNFNRPTTGAAGFLPFGGPGASGNHNPGAYYTADFCAWPMASQISERVENMPFPGRPV